MTSTVVALWTALILTPVTPGPGPSSSPPPRPPDPSPATRAAQTIPRDTLRLLPLLERALAVAPEMNRASAEAGAAAASVGSAEAARLPSVASSLSVVQFQEPMVVAPLHAFDPRAAPQFDEMLIQGRAAVQYTVWDGGARSGRIAGARAAEGAAAAGARALGQQVLERTVEAYVAVLTARDLMAVQELREEELESERARVQRFFEEGSAARVEVLRAQAELSGARADRSAALARVELAEATLARLLAWESGAVDGAVLTDVVLSRPGGTPASGAPPPDSAAADHSLVAADHPLVAAAQRRADAARATASVARAAWYPRLTASGAFHEFGGASSDFSGEWQAGLQVEYPLFTGGARSRMVDEAEARARAAGADVDATRRDLGMAVDRAVAAEREATARVAALEDALAQFEELARVETLALDEGAGVQRDFLRAQAGMHRARAGLAEARRAAILAGVRLARARGDLTLEWIDHHLERVP